MALTVAISGINAIDNPGPGTGIARALKESCFKARTIGLAYDAMEPGIYMDWLIDKTYIIPYPSADSSNFLDRLLYIHKQEGIDVIFPALDVEIPLYIKLERELMKYGIKTMVPGRTAFRDRAKDRLPRLAGRIGLKSPVTVVCTDYGDLERACRQIRFPLMVKGPYYEAVKVASIDEARHAMRDILLRWGGPVIAQEFVRGDEYNVTGLGDGAGNDLGLMAVKKMMITKLGKVWTNVTVTNEALFAAARSMVKLLKWRGGFELELIRNLDSNELYLIEVNPRFPAWIYLTAACGINLPERMVRCVQSLPFEKHSAYDAGRVMIRYTEEMIRTISDIEKVTMTAES